MTFGAHKLVHTEPFLDLYELFDTCCQCYIATCGNFFLYRCTPTFSALNYCGGIFVKSRSYLYEVVHTNVSANSDKSAAPAAKSCRQSEDVGKLCVESKNN